MGNRVLIIMAFQMPNQMPSTRTQQPIVTGTSVLGIKYKDGVMMASDTLGSYGSMSRFTDIARLKQFGNYTVVGAGGDLSDFQYIQEQLENLIEQDEALDDGSTLNPNAIHKYLVRVMYGRRSKMDPLWNSIVVGGMYKGKQFLGTVDLLGTQFEDDIIATGFGGHLAIPLLREAHEKFGTDMSAEQARKVLEDCMRVLYYRDCRTINKLQFADITDSAISINSASEPVVLDTKWDFAKYRVPGGH